MQLTRLWLVLGASLLLAVVIDIRDQKLAYLGSDRKERLFTWLLIILLGFFCGLRIWGNDTSEYLETYEHLTPTLDTFVAEKHAPAFSDGWGFIYLNILLKTLGFSNQDYLMFYAFLTVIPYVLFVRRYSTDLVWGVFLMFATGFYTFSMAAIKQSLAMGICLMSLPYALDRKWIRFALIVLLGSLMHPYAIIYFLVPLMMFEPWKGKTLLYTAIFIAAGFTLDSLIGTVLQITEMMGADYSEAEMMGAGVNLFRVMVCFVPMILAVFFGNDLFHDAGEDVHLMFNLAMINALIMFVGLFGTANYFARLANYFLPAQVVILPWMLHSAHPKDRRWLMPACIAGYLGYFYYENAIIRPFDIGYAQMSLWEYLGHFF